MDFLNDSQPDLLLEIESLELSLRGLMCDRNRAEPGERQEFIDRLIREQTGRLKQLQHRIAGNPSSSVLPTQTIDSR